MYQVRQADRADYDAIVAIRNTVSVEQVTGESLWLEDEYNRNTNRVPVARLVAAMEPEGVAGYVLVAQFPWLPPGRWWIHATVHMEHRGRGVGRLLFSAAEQFAVSRGGRSFGSACAENEAFVRWARVQGFQVRRLRTEWHLDLAAWDPAPFIPLLESVRGSGLTLAMLPSVRNDVIIRSLFELDQATRPDTPGFDEEMPGWDEWQKQNAHREGIALAMDGDRVVAASWVGFPLDKAEGCYVGFTGVLREYRGRRLAQAVKALAMSEARNRAYGFAWTHNDTDNPAIMAANERLGFRRAPGYYELLKELCR